MYKSFQDCGFTESDCEFLIVDNFEINILDAYTGLNGLIKKAKGEYVICCHQDIRLIDNRHILEERLKEINRIDKSWAVISNCGAANVGEYALRVTEGDGIIHNTNNFPFRALSVDEHFILIRKNSKILFSEDLTGFHFYGTDICLNAKRNGYNSYCVNYHIKHLGGGIKDNNYYACKKSLIKKHSNYIGWIQTTCERLYISKNRFKSKFYNTRLISYLKKKSVQIKP